MNNSANRFLSKTYKKTGKKQVPLFSKKSTCFLLYILILRIFSI